MLDTCIDDEDGHIIGWIEHKIGYIDWPFSECECKHKLKHCLPYKMLMFYLTGADKMT